MARKKATPPAATAPKKERKDPRIECIYEEDITFTCPVRGLVTQRVKIKRYKTLQEMASKHLIKTDSTLDKLEEKDDGLGIYDEAAEQE